MMKLKFTPILFALFLFCSIVITAGCKKDQIEVKETQEFVEPPNPAANYAFPFSTFHLTLQPDGTASINPGGDIVWSGTYKVSGSVIKMKTNQDGSTYTFDIISKTEIKDRGTGTRLLLKQ